MSNTDFIPKPEAEFYGWVNNFFLKVGPNPGIILMAPESAAEKVYQLMLPVYEAYKNAYLAAEDQLNATRAQIHERQQLRRELEIMLRAFIKSYITYNIDIADPVRELLRLPVHSGERHAAPVPTTYPDCDVDTSTIRRLTFDFHDRDKSGKAKPEGVHGCELKWVMRDTAPESYSELVNSSFDTHSPLTLTFDLKDKGKTVWFALRWENTRGEKGPWSELMSAIIP